MIRKMTKELAVAEFDVAKYSNVLKRTEIEVASMGEKLKELSKMIDVIQSKTNKAHIIWKSISSAELLLEEQGLIQSIEKQR